MIEYILFSFYVIYFLLHCILFSYSIYRERYNRYIYLRNNQNNELDSSVIEFV